MVMAGNESVATYRRNAAYCMEMAKEFPKPDQKLTLLDMAQDWIWLRLGLGGLKLPRSSATLCGLASNQQ
jgi:hypothetical protein